MKHIPEYKLDVISEENFLEEIKVIEEKLEKIKSSGKYKAFDNTELYYEYFLSENSTASVVIVHGLSEFTKKFYEFIYYLLNQGYNVFIFDQRCHGLSDRLTDNIDLLHVDKTSDYVKDLTQFIDEIVVKVEDKPIYLYAHSMGGATSALYLSKNSSKIQKAILSVPMFEPTVDVVPMPIARMSAKFGKVFCGSKKKFFMTSEFDPDVKYSEKHGTSESRFKHNMNLRNGNVNYQSTPMSFGWVDFSLNVGKKILRNKTIKNIKTPILLISADKDKTVNIDKHYKFSQKCENCQLIRMENSGHALLANNNETIHHVMDTIFSFYQS
ncbi:MAG: alpha/beta hydrolase [Clostridia bacterium]|nr:alpha/beta hydrolase [Clostridia bacterium]